MPDSLLSGAQARSFSECATQVRDHAPEQIPILGRQRVGALLRIFSLRKWSVAAQPFLNVGAPTLEDVLQQGLSRRRMSGSHRVDVEFRFQKAEQRAEVFLDAAMRCRGDENDMTRGIGGERLD